MKGNKRQYFAQRKKKKEKKDFLLCQNKNACMYQISMIFFTSKLCPIERREGGDSN
jgi:hypothetical protein